jgi:monooxygenase
MWRQGSADNMVDVDVLIVGAGISGIGAAVHLNELCPHRTYAIVEQRVRIGGTWDLFRYPGVRSDSDMYTLGFRFKPWTQAKSIADGPAILEYLDETVSEHRLVDKIRFDHHVTRASWSSETATWTVELTVGPDRTPTTIECRFLFMCGGYYRYDQGYLPEFVGYDDFAGCVVHPQHWPTDLDYVGKKVVVIGSGATAVTLVPAMVREGAGHVTMLQRSPTYMVSRPAEDKVANALRKALPDKVAYGITRWKNVSLAAFIFNFARKQPGKMKAKLLDGVRAELGPNYDVDTHFTPRYNPWDQRLCLIPDGDMFKVIRQGQASVVTATIECFTDRGVLLTNGEHLDADVIVTATGLNVQMLAGMQTVVDGVVIAPGDTMLHKGVMLSGVPNLGMWFGYTNASWTLKADLTSQYMCRMLNELDASGDTTVVAHYEDGGAPAESLVDFSSGYLTRVEHLLPRQGKELPWRLHQNYFKDIRLLRRGKVADKGLVFSRPARAKTPVS